MTQLDRTQPVPLSDANAERLRCKITELFKLADEIGVSQLRVDLHKLSQPSAFEAFPMGQEIVQRVSNDRSFAVWEYDLGPHQVRIYTGDVSVLREGES